MKVSTSGLVISLSVLGLVISCSVLREPGVSQPSARADGFTTLHVDGDEVRIYRDEFGVPHIFAETNRGLFKGYGYAIAQDRLWQLELFRHAAQGRLAELLGATTVPSNVQIGQSTALAADTNIRTRHYTGTELQEQLALLDAEEAEIFSAYADGINHYITAVVAADPASKLPFEFHSLGIGVPAQWTALDVVANVVYQSRFGQAGGQERQNQTLLTSLITRHGEDSAGSHGWIVSAAKSANGSAMLFGGPQVDFNTPELFHEVHLKGGNGFNVMGRAFAGVPFVYAGRTDHMAWAMTSGTFGDTRDTYIETLCGGGYLFKGVCTPFETRIETIKVKGAPSVNLTVRRTVHGPVVGTGPGVVFTQKRVVWKREIESAKQFLGINRARNLQEFETAVHRLEVCHNFLYADKVGNIAYWLSGKVPIRPVGFDPRLPLPGTGNAEWTGEFRPVPFSINPTRGWLSSWNSKPSLGYPNPDQRSFGKQWRSLEIDERLANGLISLNDMKDIAKDIARTDQGGDGREARYLKPYLLNALDVVPPSNALASQARAVLKAWDGSVFKEPIAATTREAGQVIFAKWLEVMRVNTFGDELGTQVSQASTNMLIHVLDDALGGGSGVPPSRDYFNGMNPNTVISAAFNQALAALGPNPSAWSTQPRDIVRFRHTLYPAVPEVATMFDSNRATYVYIVVLSNPTPNSESILPLGQSGFIAPDGTLDRHFKDQLERYRNFEYKPMRLFANAP